MAHNPQEDVHEALRGYLDEGELITGWVVVAEVADVNGVRLIHRQGGGDGGTTPPSVWGAMGMLRAGEVVAEKQLGDWTSDPEQTRDPGVPPAHRCCRECGTRLAHEHAAGCPLGPGQVLTTHLP